MMKTTTATNNGRNLGLTLHHPTIALAGEAISDDVLEAAGPMTAVLLEADNRTVAEIRLWDDPCDFFPAR